MIMLMIMTGKGHGVSLTEYPLAILILEFSVHKSCERKVKIISNHFGFVTIEKTNLKVGNQDIVVCYLMHLCSAKTWEIAVISLSTI